jgi:Ala-tRNA(Pro) deacylase
MIKRIENGRPQDIYSRLSQEKTIYDHLDGLKISYQRVDHDAVTSMDEYQAISDALKAPVAKNLFLANRQQTIFYLLLMPGEKKFKTKEISAQINSARLSFGNEEALKQYLNAEEGYCSILDLLYDKDNNVTLLIDQDLFKEGHVAAHPCINTTTLSLSWKDITEKFLPSIHHSYQVVNLKGED